MVFDNRQFKVHFLLWRHLSSELSCLCHPWHLGSWRCSSGSSRSGPLRHSCSVHMLGTWSGMSHFDHHLPPLLSSCRSTRSWKDVTEGSRRHPRACQTRSCKCHIWHLWGLQLFRNLGFEVSLLPQGQRYQRTPREEVPGRTIMADLLERSFAVLLGSDLLQIANFYKGSRRSRQRSIQKASLAWGSIHR